MKLKQVKFRENVDIRGNNDSGCTNDHGIELWRAPNGDVIISWAASSGRDADQIIVGHSNIKYCKPVTPIAFDGAKAESKK
jgi:hypothetical protein